MTCFSKSFTVQAMHKTAIVHLGAYDKEQICKATHKSMRRLEQAITTWVKNRVLIRVARGIYQVNPFILARRLARYRQFTRNL